MKRLASVAVMVAWLCCGAFGQRGGSRGGVSGSHGGFSGSHVGFSAPAGGFSSPSAPAFHGGFPAPRGGFRPASPGYAGPARFAPRSPSYPVRGPFVTQPMGTSLRSVTGGPHMPSSSMHRAPYHSPLGGNHFHDGHHHPHNHVVFVNGVWPVWGWGYPYLWPSIFNDSDSYDSQPSSNYAVPPPSDDSNGPYQTQPDDQQEPAVPEQYAQQPNPSHRAPYGGAQSIPPTSEAPVTLVFKDGRPPEQIHNYLLTAKTLTVLDGHRRDIPVDQIDVEATARAASSQCPSYVMGWKFVTGPSSTEYVWCR